MTSTSGFYAELKMCLIPSVCRVFVLLCLIHSASSQCSYVAPLSPNQKAGDRKVEVLKGRRLSASDNQPDGFSYDIGICTDAVEDKGMSGSLQGAGVIQYKTDGGSPSDAKVIGKYTDKHANIVVGRNWVFLEYNGGEPYGSHCSEDPERRARIMLTCDKTVNDDSHPMKALVLEEQNNQTKGCYYLFEINTSHVCEEVPFITVGLSVGSVLLIVFFSVLSVYLLGGLLYNRFVLGAKGKEQIPNYTFWQDFGNLEADGCDLVCRPRRSREPKTYKGIGDDQLDTEETGDEHLLPM